MSVCVHDVQILSMDWTMQFTSNSHPIHIKYHQVTVAESMQNPCRIKPLRKPIHTWRNEYIVLYNVMTIIRTNIMTNVTTHVKHCETNQTNKQHWTHWTSNISNFTNGFSWIFSGAPRIPRYGGKLLRSRRLWSTTWREAAESGWDTWNLWHWIFANATWATCWWFSDPKLSELRSPNLPSCSKLFWAQPHLLNGSNKWCSIGPKPKFTVDIRRHIALCCRWRDESASKLVFAGLFQLFLSLWICRVSKMHL